MATLPFMPNSDDDKADLLEHIATNLPRYADLLEISPQTLEALKADAVCFRYTLQSMGVAQAYSQSWTTFKNLQRDGGSLSIGWPALPILPEPIPPAVQPGVIPRLAALAKDIKNNKNYTLSIGQDLWLIGAEKIVDTSTWKPILSVYSEAGHPVIEWTKGAASALEIWTDRGDGNNFVFLAVNIEPNSTDLSPLPATGAVWKYKAIYRLHDQQVGQWSDVITVAVGV